MKKYKYKEKERPCEPWRQKLTGKEPGLCLCDSVEERQPARKAQGSARLERMVKLFQAVRVMMISIILHQQLHQLTVQAIDVIDHSTRIGFTETNCTTTSDYIEVVPWIASNFFVVGRTNSKAFTEGTTEMIFENNSDYDCWPFEIPFITSRCIPGYSHRGICSEWTKVFTDQLFSPAIIDAASNTDQDFDKFVEVFNLKFGAYSYENLTLNENLIQRFGVAIVSREYVGSLVFVFLRTTGNIAKAYHLDEQLDSFYSPALTRLRYPLAMNRHSSSSVTYENFEELPDSLSIFVGLGKSWQFGQIKPGPQFNPGPQWNKMQLRQIDQVQMKGSTFVFPNSTNQAWMTHIVANYNPLERGNKHIFYTAGQITFQDILAPLLSPLSILVCQFDDELQEYDTNYIVSPTYFGFSQTSHELQQFVMINQDLDPKFHKVFGLTALTINNIVITNKFGFFWFQPYDICTNALQSMIGTIQHGIQPTYNIPISVETSPGLIHVRVYYYATIMGSLSTTVSRSIKDESTASSSGIRKIKTFVFRNDLICSNTTTPVYESNQQYPYYLLNLRFNQSLGEPLNQDGLSHIDKTLRDTVGSNTNDEYVTYYLMNEGNGVYGVSILGLNYLVVNPFDPVNPTTIQMEAQIFSSDYSDRLINYPITSEPLSSSFDSTIIFPTCIGELLYSNSNNDQFTGVVSTQTDRYTYKITAGYTVDYLRQHKQFICAADDPSKCNVCPLVLQWGWSNGISDTEYWIPPGYNASITEEVRRKPPVERQMVINGNFVAKSLTQYDETMKYYNAIQPNVSTSVLYTDIKESFVARYIMVWNIEFAMVYPSCMGFCTYNCFSSEQQLGCYGKFVRNQIYKVQYISSSCYQYIGPIQNCLCDPPVNDVTLFRLLPACPRYSSSGLTTDVVFNESQTYNLTIDTQYDPYTISIEELFTISQDLQSLTWNSFATKEVGEVTMDADYLYFLSAKLLQLSNISPHDFIDYTIVMYLPLYYRIEGTLNLETSLPRTIPNLYEIKTFTLTLKVNDCTNQSLGIQDQGPLELNVPHVNDTVILLSDLEVKALFALADPSLFCEPDMYNVVKSNVRSDELNQKFFLTERNSNGTAELKVDLEQFLDLNPLPAASLLNYTFSIIPSYVDTNIVVTAVKEIHLLIQFYDCKGKLISVENTSKTLDYDVDTDENNKYELNFSSWFTATDANCPILSYSTVDSSSKTPEEVYSLPNQNETIIKFTAKKGGTYRFQLLAATSNEISKVDVTLFMRPCKEGFSKISPPKLDSYSGQQYFKEINADGEIEYEISSEIVSNEDKESLKANISLSKFSNDNDELCPLSYSIDYNSSDGLNLNLPLNLVDDKILIQIPLSLLEQQIYSFRVYAQNYKLLNATTPDIIVTAQQLELEPGKPIFSFPPSFVSDYLTGIVIDDLWPIFVKDPFSESLNITFELGQASDPDTKDINISYSIPVLYEKVLIISDQDYNISLVVNMTLFYQNNLMPIYEQQAFTTIKIILNDGLNEKLFEIPVTFSAKSEIEEEQVKEPESEAEVKAEVNAESQTESQQGESAETAVFEEKVFQPPPFVPKFDFNVVPERVANNEPIKIAQNDVVKEERTQPQISSIKISGYGQCEIVFSKAMMYPKNWVSKHLRDAQLNEVELILIDSIEVPFLAFWYEQVQYEEPYKQQQLPDKDIQIVSLTATSIIFRISFDSLDNPDAISLTDSVEQDLLIVQVPKGLILNSQDGVSMVLDSADYNEEDANNYYLDSSLQPQKIDPQSGTTQNLQNAADSGPAVTAAVQGISMASMLITNSPPEDLGNQMSAEQQSAANTGMKIIQPGQVNGYNQNMQKASSANYQQLDFLSAQNMTWTSSPPQGEGIKRMGVESKNAPKQVGSLVIGGSGAIMASKTMAPALKGAYNLVFEGGETVDPRYYREKILQLRKKWELLIKAPITPTVNTFIGTVFMKMLLGGITNAQNNNLLKWNNFGPNGTLSLGDQVSIIFGNLCLVLALTIMVMISVNLVYTPPWMFQFGKKAQGVENILRRQGNHKWFLFSMGQLKTFLIVYIIVFMSNPNFSVPQLMLALIVNPSNLFIAWNLVPLPVVDLFGIRLNLTKIAKVTDVFTIMIIYSQLMSSDVNPPPVSTKILIGYIILFLGQIKFYLGNLKQVGHDYNVHQSKINAFIDKVKTNLFWCIFHKKDYFDQRVSFSKRFFILSRKQLVHDYQLQYKQRFYKLDKLTLNPKNFNKVAPIEAFKHAKPKKELIPNIYLIRNKELSFQEKLDNFQPGFVSEQMDTYQARYRKKALAQIIEENYLSDNQSFVSAKDPDAHVDAITRKLQSQTRLNRQL